MNKHISKNDKPFLWYILPVSIFIKTDWSQSIWLLPQSNRLSWHYAHVTRPSKGGKSVCRGYVSHYYSWPTSNGKASINELMSSLVFVLAQDSFTAVSRFGLCHSVEWPFGHLSSITLPLHSPIRLCSWRTVPPFIYRWWYSIRSTVRHQHWSKKCYNAVGKHNLYDCGVIGVMFCVCICCKIAFVYHTVFFPHLFSTSGGNKGGSGWD